MQINQFDIWIADLNSRKGTEPGKARPVVVVQTNLLNKIRHPSTIVCPVTTNVVKGSEILRVHIDKDLSKLQQNSDVMIDQIRAIDNKRLIKKVGSLSKTNIDSFKENIKILLDID